MSETARQLEESTIRVALQFAEPRVAAIPAGWFTMGYANGRDDERPVHRVWVDRFELCIYQLTRAEYAYFLRETRRAAPPFWDDPDFQEPQQPVVGPSWFDATAFCEWLSKITARNYRLPTEAEWERAARGGVEGDLYSWGNTAPEELPGYASRWRNAPEPVGLYAPNPYGLFNMGDNVHEWCADWYDAHYYERSPERNPQGPEHGSRRASRGGAWRHLIKASRCAARSSIPPEFKYADYGFRVARSL
ncbi:MAG TPA: SUMF1/EgtB/PvdO family nonheme iron enzyme [Rugosimonospora sp.]|nr:SUMF1/EgtB/PvdO family nonheme iron enzyme [Rugosimonospora sp.]